ncbi:type II secretion system F family protein [Nocardioides alkalitolerans]|uniref:type II secretion system F family protein n=1 Tax=Nocardioides alkalitolerans TaxID=281714 RepID=UPI0004290DE2|nr:type II secretion system F family protein [Nocardioides alkalitolerans]
MVVLALFGALLLVAAFTLAWLALGRTEAEAGGITRSLAMLQAMSRAPEELKKDVDRPFSERVLDPLLERITRLGARLTGGDAAVRIQRKLDHAGSPAGWTIDRVASTKVVGAIAGAAISLLLVVILGPGIAIAILLVGVGAALGFFGPDMWLYQRSYDRAESISDELADSIDLLTISVESGLGFDAALQQVARNTEGPLGEEFARVLKEMQLGVGRSAAMRNLADRTKVDDLKSFIGALVQADAFGVPIGQVLRTQSKEMRLKRRQYAEKRAQQVPVKITVPLILLILPCLFIAVMGPAVLAIMDSGFGG